MPGILEKPKKLTPKQFGEMKQKIEEICMYHPDEVKRNVILRVPAAIFGQLYSLVHEYEKLTGPAALVEGVEEEEPAA